MLNDCKDTQNMELTKKREKRTTLMKKRFTINRQMSRIFKTDEERLHHVT